MDEYPWTSSGQAVTSWSPPSLRDRTTTPAPSFRVGKVERAAACDALAEHYAAGRLDPAELDDRLARAMAARTHQDLRVLFVDLGPRRTPPQPSRPRPLKPARGPATGCSP